MSLIPLKPFWLNQKLDWISAYPLPNKPTEPHVTEMHSFLHTAHICELRFAFLVCPHFAPDLSDRRGGGSHLHRQERERGLAIREERRRKGENQIKKVHLRERGEKWFCTKNGPKISLNHSLDGRNQIITKQTRKPQRQRETSTKDPNIHSCEGEWKKATRDRKRGQETNEIQPNWANEKDEKSDRERQKECLRSHTEPFPFTKRIVEPWSIPRFYWQPEPGLHRREQGLHYICGQSGGHLCVSVN